MGQSFEQSIAIATSSETEVIKDNLSEDEQTEGNSLIFAICH